MPENKQTRHLLAQIATRPVFRAAVLFANFFLIITALYHLKPASRSLILESHTTIDLPYIWIGSAALILLGMPFYQKLLRRYKRQTVVAMTLTAFTALLVIFWMLLRDPGDFTTIAFYLLVDIIGVTLVEQAWSLTNSLFETDEAKSWYGLVGTGGLLGGVAGSAISGAVIRFTSLQTPDLLLITAFILILLLALNIWMHFQGIYDHDSHHKSVVPFKHGLRALLHNRYLILIAGGLLIAQLVSPLVEYQFMGVVEQTYTEREARTAALSLFFTVLSGFSIGVNLLLTPLILKFGGVLSGLLVQPLLMSVSVIIFSQVPGYLTASAMKISDRGLSYSLTRASRELLYIPIPSEVIFESKAWIDMFGYRLFKVFGAGLILLVASGQSVHASATQLNLAILLACLGWIGLLMFLYRQYRSIQLRGLRRGPGPSAAKRALQQ